MLKPVNLLLGALTLLLWTQSTTVVSAQANSEASHSISVDYPNSATFALTAPTTLTAATLHYSVQQFSCVDSVTQVAVETNGNQAEWTWVMNRSGNPPPGAMMEWFWTLTDENGNVSTTDTKTFRFNDDRFNWQTIDQDGVILHWYEGDNVGPTLHAAAVDGLDRLENEMGIILQQEVELFIYEDSQEMREAIVYVQDWAGGVAFTEYGVILMGVPPEIADGWGVDTIQHELAHLVVGQFGRSCVGGNRPTWLEEGLAMYAQGEADEQTKSDVAKALAEDSFFPVTSLEGAFPAHGSGASLAYSQSFSIVSFLIETYGQEKLQALITTIAAGESVDDSLIAIYGFDSAGLEHEWRQSIGALPRVIEPTTQALSANEIATAVPLDGFKSVATPPSAAATAAPAEAESGGGSPAGSGGFCNGLAPILGLVFVADLARRRFSYAI